MRFLYQDELTRPILTVEGLRNITSKEARDVIDAAARLAELRINRADSFEHAFAFPWAHDKDPANAPIALSRMDLLRALFALYPEEVKRGLLPDVENWSSASSEA